jgi:hypothetical protein
MALKAILAAMLAAAIVVGFILPAPHGSKPHPRSQIDQLDLRR